MPSFRFVDADFRAMSLYLASLKTPPAAMSPADTYKTLCLRCHGEKGDGHGAIAWYLDPYPRDLTKAGFINSKSAGPPDQLRRERRRGHVDARLGQRPEGASRSATYCSMSSPPSPKSRAVI